MRKLQQHDAVATNFTQERDLVVSQQLDQLRAEAGFAAGAHIKRDVGLGEFGGKGGHGGLEIAPLVGKLLGVHVRGQHRVRDAVGHRSARQRQGLGQRVGAVVKTG